MEKLCTLTLFPRGVVLSKKDFLTSTNRKEFKKKEKMRSNEIRQKTNKTFWFPLNKRKGSYKSLNSYITKTQKGGRSWSSAKT